MTQRTPVADPAAVTAYIEAADEPARSRLRALRRMIRREAPDAIERITYGIPTWHQGENLLHLGAFRHHVGVYPGSEAIVVFARELAKFPTSRGAIQLPHEAALPLSLVRRITRWRVERVTKRSTLKRRAARTTPDRVPADIAAYHAAQSPGARAICEALAGPISKGLPEAEGKVWHGHPVWFLDGNPIVGYSAHKEGVRLFFWSGRSFDAPGLSPVGKFQAAEARFSSVRELDEKALRRWLRQGKRVQWDYKNLGKRRGVLERLR